MAPEEQLFIPEHPWDWNIYLHVLDFMVVVGKHIPYIIHARKKNRASMTTNGIALMTVDMRSKWPKAAMYDMYDSD